MSTGKHGRVKTTSKSADDGVAGKQGRVKTLLGGPLVDGEQGRVKTLRTFISQVWT